MVVTRRSGNNAAEKMVVRSPKKRPTTKRGLKCREPQRKQPSKKELVTPCRGMHVISAAFDLIFGVLFSLYR